MKESYFTTLHKHLTFFLSFFSSSLSQAFKVPVLKAFVTFLVSFHTIHLSPSSIGKGQQSNLSLGILPENEINLLVVTILGQPPIQVEAGCHLLEILLELLQENVSHFS